MEKEKFLAYEAPVVEVIEVEVEKGFEVSPVTSQSFEDLTVGGTW